MKVLEELVRQDVFLNSILTGFAFAVVVQLVSLKDQRKISAATTAVFIAASSIMLTSMFLGTILLTAIVDIDILPSQKTLERVQQLQFPTLVTVGFTGIGLGLFAIGLLLMGWMHSNAMGKFSVAVLTIAFIVAAIIAITIMS